MGRTSSIKSRATGTDIFQRLQHLLGPEARAVVDAVAGHADGGRARDAIDTLRAFDIQIGGYCGMPPMFSKPPGAYRPLGYMAMFLEHPRPREMARFIVDAICQHVENLLQRITRLGFLNKMSNKHFTMGQLVHSMQFTLPNQLYRDLQWLASEIYNHAKHSVDVLHSPTPEERAHYFALEEALAIFLIGRKLAVQLEQWSGKSRESLMEERM
jgi:hypothetical protein